MREGVHKIEYNVEGNKTVMDLYYETGCVFRETYIDGKLISIECPKEQNTESFITSRIHKLVSANGLWKILFFCLLLFQVVFLLIGIFLK